MTMPAEAFVDTNVLLRAFHRTFPEHERVRALVDQLLHEDCELWISRQVIREYLVQVTHPNTFTPPLTIAQVIRQLAQIEALFRIADDTHDVTAHLLALLQACRQVDAMTAAHRTARANPAILSKRRVETITAPTGFLTRAALIVSPGSSI